MAVFSNIKIEESSTITAKAATVTQTRNSSAMHQELVSIADPESSLAILAIRNATPASTAWGIVTRPLFSSTGADNPVRPIFSSTNTDNPVRAVLSSTAADNPVRAILSSTAADNPVTVSGTVAVTGYSTIVSVANQVRVSNSTATDLLVRPVFSSTNTDNPVRAILSSTAADNPVTVSGTVSVSGYSTIVSVANQVRVMNSTASEFLATIQGNSTVFQGGSPWVFSETMQSSVAPSSGSSGVIVRPVIDNILTAASTNAFASTSFSVQSSGAALRSYVTAYSITSTVQTATKMAFYSSGTMMWPVSLQAVSSGISGANLAVSAPAYLFRTAASEALTLQVPSSIAGFRVAVSYFRAV